TEPAKLARQLRGELDWIIMKALEKDRNRRYETANSLAMDVQRFLADEPVQACPPSAWYRFQKLVARNKGLFLASAAATVVLVLGVVGLVRTNLRIEREKSEKEAAVAEAEANLVLARQAVDEIYTPVAEQLDVLPHMQPYQRDVLEKTL